MLEGFWENCLSMVTYMWTPPPQTIRILVHKLPCPTPRWTQQEGRKKGRRKERRKGGQKTEEKRKKIKQNKEKDERNSMGDKFQLGALES